ncbi:hypothetical protein V6L77_12070 [Pannonibacter sp. Pt2-lr]
MTNSPMMTGAWFPGPEKSGFDALASRYQAAFGSPPPRNASLAYDGTILAAGLVRSAGPQRFATQTLTNRDGFLGIDGVFRFLQNGQNERGLAVYEITGSGVKPVSPPRAISAAPAEKAHHDRRETGSFDHRRWYCCLQVAGSDPPPARARCEG